jgi:hypothetical protein
MDESVAILFILSNSSSFHAARWTKKLRSPLVT